MNNLQLRQILLEIQANLRCMQCGQPYKIENIHLRGGSKNMYLFQLICNDHTALATITVVGQKPLKYTKVITISDVAHFHDQLRSFDGNFKKVFKRTK